MLGRRPCRKLLEIINIWLGPGGVAKKTPTVAR
jgi:hypothetical protein